MADRQHTLDLKRHIERIRASGLLNRSQVLRRLFDFIADTTLAGRRPKELELAIDVFGRDAKFALVQDAVVRVSIHKLRRKLDMYYAGSGRVEAMRIVIPRGEYRLVLEPMTAKGGNLPIPLPPPAIRPAAAETTGRRRLGRGWIVAMLATLSLNAIAWIVFWPPATSAVRQARSFPVWRDLTENDLPIYLVVGDYYIFGELADTSPDVRRLVREFQINSRTGLESFLVDNPQFASRYIDVSLQYLPMSVAHAMSNILPLLPTQSAGRIQVILASELKPAMLKSANVVYMGLLSGLGILRDLAFSKSQFEIGDSYDELVERKSGKRYVSQAAGRADDTALYNDYGYFSTAGGPQGNRVVIMAGTRDVAAMRIAEVVTHAASLETLISRAGAKDFEALYTVQALDRTDISARLLHTNRLSGDH